jgi:hypothetical protein
MLNRCFRECSVSSGRYLDSTPKYVQNRRLPNPYFIVTHNFIFVAMYATQPRQWPWNDDTVSSSYYYVYTSNDRNSNGKCPGKAVEGSDLDLIWEPQLKLVWMISQTIQTSSRQFVCGSLKAPQASRLQSSISNHQTWSLWRRLVK